jgi:hypothetical protein
LAGLREHLEAEHRSMSHVTLSINFQVVLDRRARRRAGACATAGVFGLLGTPGRHPQRRGSSDRAALLKQRRICQTHGS